MFRPPTIGFPPRSRKMSQLCRRSLMHGRKRNRNRKSHRTNMREREREGEKERVRHFFIPLFLFPSSYCAAGSLLKRNVSFKREGTYKDAFCPPQFTSLPADFSGKDVITRSNGQEKSLRFYMFHMFFFYQKFSDAPARVHLMFLPIIFHVLNERENICRIFLTPPILTDRVINMLSLFFISFIL